MHGPDQLDVSEQVLPVTAPPRQRNRWIQGRKKTAGIVAVTIILAAIALAIHRAGMKPAKNSSRPVAVAKVDRENLVQTIKLAAEFQPYQQVSLHAKVSGYVQSISVDVGDRVKEGQVLAVLDTPELKNDLQKDKAALGASEDEVARAQANYNQTHVAGTRLLTVAQQHPKLVAQQEVDDAKAKDDNAAGALAAAKRHVEEAQAELEKTQALFNYSNIIAPFDAIVTHRYADPGALIQAGTSSSQTAPVVDIEEESRLRLVFPVPESAVARMKVGQKVRVAVTSLNETFEATVSRFSDKVDRETRTMRTEADIDNRDGRYKPGMYAEAVVVVEQHDNAVSVPVEAVSVTGKPLVLVVDQKGVVQARPVTLGLETPTRYEILKGVSPGDMVVVGSRAGLRGGDKVAPKMIELAAAE